MSDTPKTQEMETQVETPNTETSAPETAEKQAPSRPRGRGGDRRGGGR